MKLSLSLFLMLALSGCSSIASIWVEDLNDNPCERSNHIYGGVKIDASIITEPFKGESPVWLMPYGLIDIAPSAIMDTLLLPITIPPTVSQNKECEKFKSSKAV